MHIVYANGYYYDGDVDIFGRKHGYGIAVSDDGERYEGEWRHGKMHGKGKLIYPQGGWCYEGEFRSDRRCGQGKLRYTESVTEGPKAGSYYEGTFKDDKFWDGKAREYTDSAFYEGAIHNGAKNGTGKIIRPNGSWFEGIFKNNDPWEGKIFIVSPDGGYFEGELHDGEKNGQGSLPSQTDDTLRALIKTIPLGRENTYNFSRWRVLRRRIAMTNYPRILGIKTAWLLEIRQFSMMKCAGWKSLCNPPVVREDLGKAKP